MLMTVAIGIISGIISGMGIGGGTVLIPALIMLYGIEQQTAQNINLIYFIPTAAIAVITHMKEGNIDKTVIKPFMLWGIIGAVIGSVIAISISSGILRKIFGVFLLIMGIIEFRKKDNNEKERYNES